jgi:hypothetical protein
MSYRETEHLRVLIANEHKDRLALVAPIVVAQGHEVVAREMDVETSVVTASGRMVTTLVVRKLGRAVNRKRVLREEHRPAQGPPSSRSS